MSVLQAEREKRKDWKAQAIRNAAEKSAADEQIKAAEERFKALQAQLDELKKAPPPVAAPPPAQVAPITPTAPVMPAFLNRCRTRLRTRRDMRDGLATTKRDKRNSGAHRV